MRTSTDSVKLNGKYGIHARKMKSSLQSQRSTLWHIKLILRPAQLSVLTKKLTSPDFAGLEVLRKSSLNPQPNPASTPRFIEGEAADIQRTYDYLEHGAERTAQAHPSRLTTASHCFGTGYAQRNAVQEFCQVMVCGKKFCLPVIPARNGSESAC